MKRVTHARIKDYTKKGHNNKNRGRIKKEKALQNRDREWSKNYYQTLLKPRKQEKKIDGD